MKSKSIDDYDAYCFDLDGTVYLDNTLLPGVVDLIEKLRSHQKRILFISNTSIHTRESCQKRLASLGIDATVDEIMTTAHLAAQYFEEHYAGADVFVVGDRAVEEEFLQASIRMTKKPEEATHVLVGMDRSFTYDKLNKATMAVREGAALIVTNPDVVCPVVDGYMVDAYGLASAVEVASETTIQTIIGKPSFYYSQIMMKKLQLPSNRCLIIGDRLETDILLGKHNNISTCLVLTGVSKRKDIVKTGIHPDFVVEDLRSLLTS